MRAAGGTKLPFMFDCDIWDSIPKVYAECLKPVNTNKQKLNMWTVINVHFST